jgi:hypothetical protein
MHRQLPWSTTNEDLVDPLGQVELAEIFFDGTRWRVQFAQVAEAGTAVGTFLSKLFPSCLKRCGDAAKFQQYNARGETPRCTLQ